MQASLDPPGFTVARKKGIEGMPFFVEIPSPAGLFFLSPVLQASFDPPGFTVAVKKDRAIERLLVINSKFVLNVLGEGREKVRGGAGLPYVYTYVRTRYSLRSRCCQRVEGQAGACSLRSPIPCLGFSLCTRCCWRA